MRIRRASLAATVLAALLAGGCGTITNMTDVAPSGLNGGQRLVYGGVRWDLEVAWPMGPAAPSRNPGWPNWPRFVFFLLDIPASLFGDTLTLPFTVFNGLGSFGPGRETSSP